MNPPACRRLASALLRWRRIIESVAATFETQRGFARWCCEQLTPAGVTVAGVLVLGLVGHDGLSRENAWTPTLTLCVRNYAGVAEERLRRAEEEVTTIYGQIDVDAIWVDQSGNSCDVSARRAVTVILLSGEMWSEHVRALGLRSHLLGHAVRVAERTYLSWDQIDELAHCLSRDSGEILGLVVAHEVAHLLLPANDHSSQGIMRADLGLFAPRVRPHFARPEAESIRARLIGEEPKR